MITGINHITLAVKNIGESFSFYRDILGFKPLCKWNCGAYFLVGDLWFCLNLDEKVTPRDDYTHIAFTVDAIDFSTIKNNILKNNLNIFKENISEGDSVYFLDPNGHKLEIHVGSWQTRIFNKKKDHGLWQDVEFFI